MEKRGGIVYKMRHSGYRLAFLSAKVYNLIIPLSGGSSMQTEMSIRQMNLKNHFVYDSWKYLLAFAVACFFWEITYTVTTYRSPQDKRIDVYIMSNTVSDEQMKAFLDPIWQSTVPDMELVEGVPMIATSSDDYYTQMNVTVKMAAGEGDIYFLTKDLFKSYALNGFFLPLDEYITSGRINVDGIDVEQTRLTVMDEESGEVTSYVYGIPTDSLYGYMDGMLYDNRGGVMGIAINNGNTENVVPFFNALIEAGRAEKPDWLKEAEEAGQAQ